MHLVQNVMTIPNLPVTFAMKQHTYFSKAIFYVAQVLYT